jgi:hypothetical protein
LSDDPRRLGIRLHDIHFSPPYRDITATAINLRSGTRDLAALGNGWSLPEQSGCWTNGPAASLQWHSLVSLPVRGNLILRVSNAFGPPSKGTKGRVEINGHTLGPFLVPPGHALPTELAFAIPETILGDRDMEVRIMIDEPTSPAELGLSADRRRLGLSVESIRVEP